MVRILDHAGATNRPCAEQNGVTPDVEAYLKEAVTVQSRLEDVQKIPVCPRSLRTWMRNYPHPHGTSGQALIARVRKAHCDAGAAPDSIRQVQAADARVDRLERTRSPATIPPPTLKSASRTTKEPLLMIGSWITDEMKGIHRAGHGGIAPELLNGAHPTKGGNDVLAQPRQARTSLTRMNASANGALAKAKAADSGEENQRLARIWLRGQDLNL